MFRRNFSTKTRLFQAIVFPKLQNVRELEKFVNKSNGNVHDLVPGPAKVVDAKIVRKMLRLSGLESDISPETEQRWIDALNTQIGFIDQLQTPDEGTESSSEASPNIFRLISSDHRPTEPLGLEKLMRQVSENQDQCCGEELKDISKFVNTRVKL